MNTFKPNSHSKMQPAKCPSAVDLAGYIDGRCIDEDQAGAIEFHLAQCSDCLAAVRDLRLMQLDGIGAHASMQLVAPHVLQAAMALFPADGLSGARSTTDQRWWRAVRRASAAAAAVGLGVLGYHVGGSLPSASITSSSGATQAYEIARSNLGSQASQLSGEALDASDGLASSTFGFIDLNTDDSQFESEFFSFSLDEGAAS
jgi:anti-sigma factor RsiW